MQSMLKKDFWYDLPKELIAQEPADPRDSARLMILSQKDDSIQHRIFRDLPEYLEPGDLLVVNNSKVLPARIVGVKQPTGAVCELLLLRQVKGDQWECLAKPGKRMQPGTKVSFGDGTLTAVVDETLEDGNKFVTIMTPRPFMKNWMNLARCHCHPTSPSSWKIRASIRRSMPRSWAALLHPRQACTLPRS